MFGILPQSVRFPICCCMFQKQGAWARAAELGVSISGFSLDRARLPELGTEKKRTRLTIKRRCRVIVGGLILIEGVPKDARYQREG